MNAENSEKKAGKKPDFEAQLKRLEEIVEELERGEVSLDKSLALFEEGQKLLKQLRGVLDKAQVRVEKLLDDGRREEIDPDSLGR